MAVNSPFNLPVATQGIASAGTWLPTNPWYRFFLGVFQRLRGFGAVTWAAPSGTGTRVSFDMNWTTAVSNPPTQAEVTAMRNQVIALQKALGQSIIDNRNAGLYQ